MQFRCRNKLLTIRINILQVGLDLQGRLMTVKRTRVISLLSTTRQNKMMQKVQIVQTFQSRLATLWIAINEQLISAKIHRTETQLITIRRGRAIGFWLIVRSKMQRV